jgi:hypothetical protein
VYRLDGSLLPTPQELADENARLQAELEQLKAQLKGRGKKR